MTTNNPQSNETPLARISTKDLELMLTEIEQDVAQIRTELAHRRGSTPGTEALLVSEQGDFTWLKGGWSNLFRYMRDLIREEREERQ